MGLHDNIMGERGRKQKNVVPPKLSFRRGGSLLGGERQFKKRMEREGVLREGLFGGQGTNFEKKSHWTNSKGREVTY